MAVEYALYKGDNFLDIGTIKELSERYDISVKTLRWYSTPCYKNKIKNKKNIKSYVVVRIEDEEDEEDEQE